MTPPVKTLLTTTLLCLVVSYSSNEVQAANECKIKYQYNSSSGGKIVRRTKFLSLNSGQKKTLNRSRIDYVKNIKDNEIKLYNRNMVTNKAYIYKLNKNGQDPAVGNHLVNVKLERVECVRKAAAPIDQVARQMKQAGNSATQVATHLKNVLGQTPQQVVKWLKLAGFTPAQIVEAIRSVFNLTATKVAEWLKAASYSATETLTAIKSVFNIKATAAATILSNVFRVTKRNISRELKRIGFPINEVAKALKSLRVSAKDAVSYMKRSFNSNMQVMARALRTAGYKAADIARALRDGYNATATEIKPVLQAVGYSATQAASAVSSFAEQVEDRNVSVATINESRMPHANVSVTVNQGSSQAFLRVTGEGLQQVVGVAGLPTLNVIVHREKATIGKWISNFPMGNPPAGNYLLIELHFRSVAGRWSGATSGQGYLRTKNGRKLTDSEFRWQIREASAPTRCPKGKRLVKGVCR